MISLFDDYFYKGPGCEASLILLTYLFMLQKFLLGLLVLFAVKNSIARDFYTREIGGRENGRVRYFSEIPGPRDIGGAREYSLMSMGKKGLEIFPYTFIIDCRLKTVTYGHKGGKNDLTTENEALAHGIEVLEQGQINSILGPACNS